MNLGEITKKAKEKSEIIKKQKVKHEDLKKFIEERNKKIFKK